MTWLADEVNWTADQVDLILSIGRYAATRPRPTFPTPRAGPSHTDPHAGPSHDADADH